MSPTRQTLHNLIDIVDTNEVGIIYQLLMKFIPEDVAAPDEVAAIKTAHEQMVRGDVVGHSAIDWN